MLIYALRGLAVTLSVFVLTYFALRMAVAGGWWLAERSRHKSLRGLSPNMLYALQIGPFSTSLIIAAVFTLPAFLRFEPRAASEEFGPPVVILSAICVALLGAGFYRAYAAYARTARLVSRWKRNAVRIENASLPIYETGPNTPPLVVAGIFRQNLLISSSTSGLLSQEELARAIAHESAHIQNFDNIKKLTLRLCSFPPAGKIEQTWLGALEIAADQSAVSNKWEALDLASALVKASRVAVPTAELVTNLSSDTGALLHARVERLLAWEQGNDSVSARYARAAVTTAAALLTLVAVTRYDLLLSLMHELAELLMR